MRRLPLALLLAFSSPAAAYDPTPWLADLAEARRAIDTKYANLEWLTQERGFDLDAAFSRTAERLRAADSEAAARAILERHFSRFRDGHVAIRWPEPAPDKPAQANAAPAPLCSRLGYDQSYAGNAGTAPSFTGYRPLPGDNVLPAGTFHSGARTIGAIRLGVFMPQGYPALCEEAARALGLAQDAPCDDTCKDEIEKLAYRRFTADLVDRLTALKATGAEALLLDLGGNGGGSEWAEVVARMLTPKRLVSTRRGYVRGPHWAKIWRSLESDFIDGARRERGPLRRQLLAWAQEARAAALDSERVCKPGGDCPRIGRTGFSTGLLGHAPPGSFAGKPWATAAWQLARYEYREGVWDRPLLILIDQESWSAAEEVPALVQDNKAGIVIGARSGGAGCGHTDGGTPTTLANSKAVLLLPDCIRFRADGSNEVDGIVPDVAVAIRYDDAPAFKARLIEAKLPEALAAAAARLP